MQPGLCHCLVGALGQVTSPTGSISPGVSAWGQQSQGSLSQGEGWGDPGAATLPAGFSGYVKQKAGPWVCTWLWSGGQAENGLLEVVVSLQRIWKTETDLELRGRRGLPGILCRHQELPR